MLTGLKYEMDAAYIFSDATHIFNCMDSLNAHIKNVSPSYVIQKRDWEYIAQQLFSLIKDHIKCWSKVLS